jgi:hypothetical protein
VSYKLRTIKRDALGEFVKCKTSKTIFQPKFTKMSDISDLQTGFQRGFLDMSGSQTGHVWASLLPHRLSPWPDLSGPLSRFQRSLPDMSSPQSGHVRAPPYLRVSRLIRLLTRVPESFPRHDQSPTRTCPIFPSRSAAKSQNRTCPVPRPGSSKVGRICPTPDSNMSGSLTSQRTDSLGGYKRSPMSL